jgi:hypothetical protein
MTGANPALRVDARLVTLGLGLIFSVMFLGRFYLPAHHGLDVQGYPIGRDFINNWVGPKVAFGGDVAHLYDIDAYIRAMNLFFGHPLPDSYWGYAPFCLLMYWPLSQMPYFWALATWTFGLFGLFAWTASRMVAPQQRLSMVVALACAPACLINAVGGQNGFLTGSLLLGGVLCIDRRPILAGVLFGLLTFKPHLGVVLPLALLTLRAWRTILAAVLTAIALVAASIAIFGLEPWRQYVFAMSTFQVGLLQGFAGFYTYMMCSVLTSLRTLGLPFSWASIVQWMIAAPVIVASGLSMAWTNDPRQRAMILATAAPLATPYVFNYDLTALTAVVAWRLLDGGPQPGPSRALLFLAWLTPIVLMPLNMHHLPIAPFALLPLFVMTLAACAPPGLRQRVNGLRVRLLGPNRIGVGTQ